jgi:hypothetical protein
MRGDDMRAAAARRDDGVRRIRRLTWRAGAAGVAGSALIAVAFGHHAAGQAAQHHSGRPGTILVPAQPPSTAPGGGQVTSGAS